MMMVMMMMMMMMMVMVVMMMMMMMTTTTMMRIKKFSNQLFAADRHLETAVDDLTSRPDQHVMIICTHNDNLSMLIIRMIWQAALIIRVMISS